MVGEFVSIKSENVGRGGIENCLYFTYLVIRPRDPNNCTDSCLLRDPKLCRRTQYVRWSSGTASRTGFTQLASGGHQL